MIALDPAYEFLIAALRQDPDDAERATIEHASERVDDWERVVHLASWHETSGLVVGSLSAARANIPSDALASLRDNAGIYALRSALIMSTVRDVTRALHRDGIAVMLLKGAALVGPVYTSTSARQMSDADILVRENDIERAVAIVRAMGLREWSGHGGPREREKMRREHRHVPALVTEDGAVGIEIHRNLFGGASTFTGDDLWQRALPTEEEAAVIPCAEHMVLHIAAHFGADRRWHSRGALRQLVDIAEVLRISGSDFDRELFVTEVLRSGQRATVYAGLLATKMLFGTKAITSEMLEALRPPGFTDALGERFIDSRVLRAHQWLPLESLAARKHPLRRLVPRKTVAVDRHRLDRDAVPRFYLRRMGHAVRLVVATIVHPVRSVGDRSLNRLLRDERNGEPSASHGRQRGARERERAPGR